MRESALRLRLQAVTFKYSVSPHGTHLLAITSDLRVPLAHAACFCMRPTTTSYRKCACHILLELKRNHAKTEISMCASVLVCYVNSIVMSRCVDRWGLFADVPELSCSKGAIVQIAAIIASRILLRAEASSRTTRPVVAGAVSPCVGARAP